MGRIWQIFLTLRLASIAKNWIKNGTENTHTLWPKIIQTHSFHENPSALHLMTMPPDWANVSPPELKSQPYPYTRLPIVICGPHHCLGKARPDAVAAAVVVV